MDGSTQVSSEKGRDGKMPCRLCDGEVYTIGVEKEVSREWMLSFFLNGHIEDYLALYDKNGEYKGIVTYKSLLFSMDEQDAIIYDKLFIGENFWENAHKLLNGERDKVVPVFRQDMTMLYLVKNEPGLKEKREKLCMVREQIDGKLLKSLNINGKSIHIKGMNDILYDIRSWLISIGIEVSVEGEMWTEIFGIEEKRYTDEENIIIDEECQWLDDLYVEYWDWLEHYAARLKTLLSRPYKKNSDKKEKVLFYLPGSFSCIESISSLVSYYLQAGKECVCVFVNREWIMGLGCKNIDNVTEIVEKWEDAGVVCCVASERWLLNNEYTICFYLSEYSGAVPQILRELSRQVVALQTTAIYTHMYITGKFEDVFSRDIREMTDYLIASDYIADWLCEHDKRWEEKILRFGYPRLDTLYIALKNELNIPDEWKDRILDKNVYLFTTYEMQQLWLDFFRDKNDNKIALWRPHPNWLADAKKRKEIEKIGNQFNVIIDDKPSYYTAFQVSNALITSVQSSVMINYLCTNKPICVCCDNYMDRAEWAMDYRNEPWFKSAYSASDGKDVLEFIEKIEAGETLISAEQALYGKYMIKNFDGKVCQRIYDYFEK